MKKVLVTGADGFIGSHLVEHLLRRGYAVRALALYNSLNHWGWLEDVPRHKDLEVVTGDVRDPFLCQKITEGIHEIYHLAALIAIPYSYMAPQSYVETNILGTLNMCEAAMKNKVKKFLQTSTSEVYGTAKQVPISEDHPLQPQSPYSASKIGADSMAMSYFNSFHFPVVVARPFNTFGPRQSARAVIPTIITQVLSGKREIKLGSVSPTRDFNFVDDTCEGMIAVMESEETIGQTVNIGSGTEYSVAQAFEIICDILATKVQLISDDLRIRPQNSEVERLLCDRSLLSRLTGHSHQHSFEAGLKKTIAWFQQEKNLQKYKADIYNV